LHVGTFTAAASFDGVAHRLPELVDLGVTAIEIIRRWPSSRADELGYDGVHPYAPQSTYGGPTA